MSQPNIPRLPTKISDFISHLTKHPNEPVKELLQPYKLYEGRLRELYAQHPEDVTLKDRSLNLVPIFAGQQSDLKIRARNVNAEDEIQKSKYIMPLEEDIRKSNGAPAVVLSLKDFKHNFNVFSESSLSDLDWSNVVAAGSSVLTPLLPIPPKYAGSKRGIRDYYHTIFTPASDVDLFLYDLTEEQALEKIKKIERAIKDSILTETTTIRTKNAITIASKHPTRHVQIVLRIYKSISEILAGFDVDCSCVAYDGEQVYASPRAIAALVTQINQIDLSRRSPSYESRLSKYSRRGFEVYWPELDRDRIDPTIYERSFARTVGLARLLVLEKLPTETDRETYLNKRRSERGRPQIVNSRRNHSLRGNIKEGRDDEITDWAIEDDVSNYHSFTIPYGEKFHARRIERLLYTKDLLLNAEWNTKEREVNLHRHPAFFGDAEDIFEDCCGCCPKPSSIEDFKAAEEESKHYVSGKISFLTDNPGRQEIGSFNPITETDWTEMAYVQNTQKLFQAIVDCDLTMVKTLLQVENIDPNVRDYTGRTPLHLAVTSSNLSIVKCLLDHGAYLVPRLAAGETSMHLAAARGDVEIMKALDEKSKNNKTGAEKRAKEEADGVDVIEIAESESDAASEASGETSNFVKVESCAKFLKDGSDEQETTDTSKIELKDDILDPDVVAWDTGCTPAHVATVLGNLEALNYLLNEHGSDPSVPIKLKHTWTNKPRGAILSLVLALTLPHEKAEEVAEELISAGARCSQADLNGVTAFHYFVNQGLEALEIIMKLDQKQAKSVLNYIKIGEYSYSPTTTTPLMTAIENHDTKTAERLLNIGANPSIDYDTWLQAYHRKHKGINYTPERQFIDSCEQPVLLAIRHEVPQIVKRLIEMGIDVNTTNKYGHAKAREAGLYFPSNALARTILDEVRAKISELKEVLLQKPNKPKAPEALKDDTYFLRDCPEGSYSHWIMTNKLTEAKSNFEQQMKQYQKIQESTPEDEGHKLREEAVTKLIEEFKELESFLVEKGAKSFVDMNSELSELETARMEMEQKANHLRELENNTHKRPNRYWQFTPSYDFNLKYLGVPEPTESQRKEYLQLFSAAWDGNKDLIQELTTVPRGENKDEPPLTISVLDSRYHNPFTIALFRGHVDLAMEILTIAQAQYTPKDVKLSYTMENEEGSYDSHDSDDDIADSTSEIDNDRIILYSRLPSSVRNQFTIEDIGKISTLVKSHVSPLQMMVTKPIVQGLQVGAALPKTLSTEYVMPRSASAMEYAIYLGDNTLFDRLLDAAMIYNSLEHETDDSKPKRFQVPDHTLQYAINMGRIEMISKMMALTCAGIPLTQLAQKTGAKTINKSKYYQGLSIRGKKNEAWAASYRRGGVPFNSEDAPPLLLSAAQEISVESFEWLLSDAPLRLYKEYAANNSDDDRLKLLYQSKQGFENTLIDWLDAKSHFALHCAVITQSGKSFKDTGIWESKVKSMVSYLIKTCPESLNMKTPSGLTPLHLAFYLRRLPLAKILLEAGADVNAKDHNGDNLMHILLSSCLFPNGYETELIRYDHEAMSEFMKLLGEEKCHELLLERNKSNSRNGGTRTPFHSWILNERGSHSNCTEHCCGQETLELLLKYSKGDALTMIDGSGDTPVHTVVLNPNINFLRRMLEINPDCLFRENAVGRTPMELARDMFLSSKVAEPPNTVMENDSWNQPQHKKNMKNRDAKSFLSDEQPNNRDIIWEVCLSHIINHTAKRRLVSLSEANEVARRLASSTDPDANQKSVLKHNDNNTEDLKRKDEVREWLPGCNAGVMGVKTECSQNKSRN